MHLLSSWPLLNIPVTTEMLSGGCHGPSSVARLSKHIFTRVRCGYVAVTSENRRKLKTSMEANGAIIVPHGKIIVQGRRLVQLLLFGGGGHAMSK